METFFRSYWEDLLQSNIQVCVIQFVHISSPNEVLFHLNSFTVIRSPAFVHLGTFFIIYKSIIDHHCVCTALRTNLLEEKSAWNCFSSPYVNILICQNRFKWADFYLFVSYQDELRSIYVVSDVTQTLDSYTTEYLHYPELCSEKLKYTCSVFEH